MLTIIPAPGETGSIHNGKKNINVNETPSTSATVYSSDSLFYTKFIV